MEVMAATTNTLTMENPKTQLKVVEEEIQHLSDKAVKDYKLVRRAVEEGDQKAYAELMARYKDSIYYMLLKMVNNRDDAEDLTIEAFGKAFRNIKQYTPDYAFSTWLFKIATNTAIDLLRNYFFHYLVINAASKSKLQGQSGSLSGFV